MELAAQHDAPIFRPHVTLLGGIHATPAIAIHSAQRLAHNLCCFSLTPRGIAHSRAYFRCLFIDLVLSHALLVARRQACRLFKLRHANYRPHISLLYGKLSQPQRQRLAAALTLPENPLSMNQLALVNMGENNQPTSWRTYRKYCLADA